MRDYSAYKKNTNTRLLNDGERIFEKQLQGLEAKIIKIDNGVDEVIEDKGIIYNNINANSTSKEDRTLNTRKSTAIRKGCYVYVEGETKAYLVLSEVDDHYVYNSSIIRRCPQKLKLSRELEIPFIAANEGFGVKLTSSNEFISESDTKIKATIQDSPLTRSIPLNTRFIINNSEHGVYKVSDISVYEEGILVMTCKKDKFMPEYDDLENGIAYNGDLDLPSEETSIEYEIEGKDSIRKGQNETYTINNPNGEWAIEDYSGSVKIASQDNNSIAINCLSYGDFITLSYKVQEEIVATKVISLVR